MNKRLALLACLLTASLALTGCTSVEAAAVASAAPAVTATTAVTTSDADDQISGMDLTFSNREIAGTYEKAGATAVAGQNNTVTINGQGADFSNGTLTISREGVYLLSGHFTDMCIVVDADDKAKVQLVLDNAQISNTTGPALYIRGADKVFLTVPAESVSQIADGTSYTYADGDTTVDAAIFSRADLCINGSGTLNIAGMYKHGVVSKDDLVIAGLTLNVDAASTGLDGKDCVKVSGGTIRITAGSNGVRSDNAEDPVRGFVYLCDCTMNVTAAKDGIQAETLLKTSNATLNIIAGDGSGYSLRSASESFKGLKSGGDMQLSGGVCTISSADDCLHANSSMTIDSGLYTLSSGDDGVHADANLTITGGVIDVQKSYEGLEASKITIAGGKISIVASDDGLNAAGGADGSGMGNRFGRGMFSNGVGEIIISGGYTLVNASGDGIDSNNSITVSGGVTLVSGPVNSGNAAFDYDGTAKVTGGVLIAAGPMGMAQNFSEAENQGAILVSFGPKAADEAIALTDADGMVLASFSPVNSYQCAVITAPEIQQGQTYTLITGCQVEGADENGFAQHTTTSGGVLIDRITMDSLLYGGGGGRGMPNMPGGGGGDDRKRRGW